MTARIARAAVAAALGLLLAASGVAGDKMPRIGLLTLMLPNPSLKEAFQQGLHELGYVEDNNIVVEWRNAISSDEELPALAAELVSSKVDVIVTESTSATRAALQATKTIPIVFAAAGDPVRTGLVESLARPGANATGVSILATELASKRLDFLHQLAPSARRVVYLTDLGNPGSRVALGPLQALAKTLGIKLETLDVRNPQGVDSALRSAAWKSADAVQMGGGIFFLGQGAKIAQDVRASKRPAIFPYREYHEFGVLMSYGADLKGVFRRAAYYVDRILKGAKPSELPVEQISKFDLVIDLRVAREQGIKVPQELLFRAEEVIR
jgi:putative ABC transport system substrate-binding protein